MKLRPDEIDSRLTNMVYLMMGIFLSRSVQSGRLASWIPLRVKRMSIVRRLERFLENGAVRVREWYAPIARELLAAASASGQVALIIDGTMVNFGHQLGAFSVALFPVSEPTDPGWFAREPRPSSPVVCPMWTATTAVILACFALVSNWLNKPSLVLTPFRFTGTLFSPSTHAFLFCQYRCWVTRQIVGGSRTHQLTHILTEF